MSHPQIHAERSARKWGGVPADYLPIHTWFDATKAHLADNRHRMILHNGFGIALAEQVFSASLQNADGQRVFVREIGLQHVREDLGFVPSLAECLSELPLHPWMAGAGRRLLRLCSASLPPVQEPDHV
jgi:hypothetical protein